MGHEVTPRCASCKSKDCTEGQDCFSDADRQRTLYEDPHVARLQKAASAIEARHYCKEHRILAQKFDVVSVCCKLCGIAKTTFGFEQIVRDKDPEVMCNPVGQATLLNEAETELNIVCGLCVGHDAVFGMTSRAPVTTLIVKDRVLAHNPVGAIYSRYIR